VPNLFEKYAPKLHAALRRVRGDTVTFSPAAGEPMDLEVLVSFRDPDGQRPTSQIVDLYAELAQFPVSPIPFDQFTVTTAVTDQAGNVTFEPVIYNVYSTRTDEMRGIWINCRKA